MKIQIGDTSYDLFEGVRKASLSDLYRLKVDTGIGMKTLMESMQKMGAFEDQMDFLDDADGLNALRALIWLCRRRAGEILTMDEANSFPLSDMAFVPDEGDEDLLEEAGMAPDPTAAPTDSGRGDVVPAGRVAKPTRSRTSKATSTATS